MRRLLVLASVATLSLAACSSDGGTAKPTDTAGGGAATTAGAPGSTTENTAPGAGSEFCTLNAALTGAESPFSNPSATAADFETFFTDVVKPGVAKLQDAAPDEIKADMDTLAEGYNTLADRFAALGFDPTKAATDTVLSQIGNEQKYNDASTAINDFCGA